MAAHGNVMTTEIESQITALVASTLHVNEATIRLEASIAGDLGAEPLDFVMLLLAIEDEFRVDIHDEDAAELLTVGQLIEYVSVALASKKHPSKKHH